MPKVRIEKSLVDDALASMYQMLSTGEWYCAEERADALREALLDPEAASEVVVTTNEDGECVAVTRQDGEGRILSVIWSSQNPKRDTKPTAQTSAEDSKRALVYKEQRDALIQVVKDLLPFTATQTIACHGDKCRELWCTSCFDKRDAYIAAGKGQDAYEDAVTCIEKIKREKV